jgi:hypothetical protein
LVKDAIEPLDEGGGVCEWDAFEEEGLVEESPCGILHCCFVGFSEELFDDLVIGVDLEGGFQLGKTLLTHGLHHLAHAGRGLVFIGNDDGGAVGEARRDANLFHCVSQGGLDPFEERLQRFGLLGFRFALQVFAGCAFVDGFEIDLTVLVDGGEDDTVADESLIGVVGKGEVA